LRRNIDEDHEVPDIIDILEEEEEEEEVVVEDVDEQDVPNTDPA
jgi:hypothetical protein